MAVYLMETARATVLAPIQRCMVIRLTRPSEDLDEPTQYHERPDPTLCFQHAAKYPLAWRSMSQEARLLAAMTAWGYS